MANQEYQYVATLNSRHVKLSHLKLSWNPENMLFLNKIQDTFRHLLN